MSASGVSIYECFRNYTYEDPRRSTRRRRSAVQAADGWGNYGDGAIPLFRSRTRTHRRLLKSLFRRSLRCHSRPSSGRE